MVDADDDSFRETFVAYITNRTLETTGTYTGLYMYDWVQQDPLYTPLVRKDASPCLEGKYSSGVSNNAAVHINNQKVDIGTFVQMKYKCTNGEPTYEFDYGNPPPPFLARLTTSSGGLGVKWKYVRLTLDSTGAYIDLGSESVGYYAIAAKIDGTNYANPAFDTRVVMWDSLVGDGSGNPQYIFLPIGYAASGFPGLVSKDAQIISGQKTLENPLKVNSTRTTTGFTPDYNAFGNTVHFQVNGGTYSGNPATLIEARQANSNTGYVYLFEEEYNAITSGGFDPTHTNYSLKCGGAGFFCTQYLSGGDFRKYQGGGLVVQSGPANTPYATATLCPNPFLSAGGVLYMARYDEIICSQGVNGAGTGKTGVVSHCIMSDYTNPSIPITYDWLMGHNALSTGVYTDGNHRYAADGYSIAQSSVGTPSTFIDGMSFSSGNYYITVSGSTATLTDFGVQGGIVVPPSWSPGPTITLLTTASIIDGGAP